MKLTVSLKEKSYDIILQRGGLSNLHEYVNLNRKVMIVTDDGVPTQYADVLSSQCKECFIERVAQGEKSKSFTVYETICESLLDKAFSRHDLVIALGGGVMGDLAGFVASTYMRGIDFVNIPTTTLSQIDSSIGGKTAVNIGFTKNIVGSFYQPKLVMIDMDTLNTLDKRNFSNGLVEAVKAGLIYDKDLFELFEADELDIEQIIYRSLLVKKAVVEQDEKEENIRQILNFGHTIGHAVESIYMKSGILHGEAVAIGMLPMLEDESVRNRVKKIYARLGLALDLAHNSQEAYDLMTRDKKSNGDSITIVKVAEIGKARLVKIKKHELIEYMK